MKSNTERERDILKQKIEAIENGYKLCIEIPWLWEVNSFNNEMREKIAKRIFRASEIRNFVREAKLALVYGGLYVDGYINQIKAWKLESNQQQTCNDHNHNHTLNCGPCVECLGTGKTLLLIAEKYVCIACKGSGIRSQEFENLDGADILRDDLKMHESDILEFQQYNEVYEDRHEYQAHELGFDVYEALGCIHEEDEKY
jgi:hypothetical protein